MSTFFVFHPTILLFVGSLSFLRHRFFIHLHGDVSVTEIFSFTLYPSLSLFLILCGSVFTPFAYILWFLFYISLSLLPALPSRRNFFRS
jgi:hypothetical protein